MQRITVFHDIVRGAGETPPPFLIMHFISFPGPKTFCWIIAPIFHCLYRMHTFMKTEDPACSANAVLYYRNAFPDWQVQDILQNRFGAQWNFRFPGLTGMWVRVNVLISFINYLSNKHSPSTKERCCDIRSWARRGPRGTPSEICGKFVCSFSNYLDGAINFYAPV